MCSIADRALSWFAGDAEYSDLFGVKLAQYERYIESLVPTGRSGKKRSSAAQQALIPADDVQVRQVTDSWAEVLFG
jgi:hypothetical protein